MAVDAPKMIKALKSERISNLVRNFPMPYRLGGIKASKHTVAVARYVNKCDMNTTSVIALLASP